MTLCLLGCCRSSPLLLACSPVFRGDIWPEVSHQGCVGMSLFPGPRRELLWPARWQAEGGLCVGDRRGCVFVVVVVCRWLLFTSCLTCPLQR